jgi:zinc protease
MILDRFKSPGFKIPEAINLTSPIKRTLKNGVPLYFIHTPHIDAIKLEVIFPTYHPEYLQDKALVPFFTLNMLLEGTKSMESGKLDDFFDFYASEVEVISGYEQHGLSLLTTKKHYQAVLPVFRSLFTEATFPEKELLKRKSQKKLTISLQKEQTAARANQLIRKILFGTNHPFGFISEEYHVDQVFKEDLHQFYRRGFLINPEIFVTGNLSDENLEEIVNQFDDLPFELKKEVIPDFEVYSEKRFMETRPQAVQASIRLGQLLIPKSHPDYHSLYVFNTILGGYFGSRLVKNIREEKAYTYGIYSILGNLTTTDYWMVLADVKKGYAEAVIDEVYKEFALLSKFLIGSNELEIVRNYMIGHFLSQFSSPFDLMGKFRKIHQQNLDFRFYDAQLEYIKTFNPEEMLLIGKKHFDKTNIKEVIVGAH